MGAAYSLHSLLSLLLLLEQLPLSSNVAPANRLASLLQHILSHSL